MQDLYIDEFFYSNFEPWSDRIQSIPSHESKILIDLWHLIESRLPLTRNQASLLCRLIQKHRHVFISHVDIDDIITQQKWRIPFREIDLSKKIYAEQDQNGTIRICLRFPYNLKSTFDELFDDANERNFSYWDHDQKVRKIELYKVNFLQILDFAKTHKFEIDKTIWDLADEIDEVWQNKSSFEKKCMIGDAGVELINASESAQEYFKNHKLNIIENDLLLAKEMGHVFESAQSTDLIKKLCSIDNNLFWIKKIEKFIDIHKRTSTKTCVILDRASDYQAWIKTFVELCDRCDVVRSEIKVCFREDARESKFNQWIKESGLGGKTDSGRIYIFLAAPAKWLYKDIKSFKIILVNNLFPHTNKNTQNLINHHPIVIYTGENRPTASKDSKIEEL